ncbi:MAG: hypothetical protein M3Y87_19300 [Myxococcota bacterium]|nr:hypothetical protein [Myxococcota bacterium]
MDLEDGARRARRLIAWGITAAVVGCGGGEVQVRADGTHRAPAAKADIDVEREGDVRDLDVEVHDLQAPASIGDRFDRYGVWMRDADGRTSLLGFLRYQSDIDFGEMEAQVPLEPFEIVITAETAAPGDEPSDAVILRRAIP